ncbi:hypothetical protein [Acidithiobacillus sp. HP-11]|uniref:hypothetical protein n=1 Tax=Acidithiobacillus sp. HP-11 TaxID=2697656 RepID=UPI00187A1021|nr:hypothetical protein [Acidithiobacillus sp. HP-11]MBE7567817.1 hypothetical protein [Acidithiobacillus sp. HP-11]
MGRLQVAMGGNGKWWQVDGKSPVDKTDTWHVALWIKTERFCKWLIGNEYDLMMWMWLGVSRGGFNVKKRNGINGLAMLSTSGGGWVWDLNIPKNSAEGWAAR